MATKKGKATIGIAMATVMLASVFAMMIGSTGAYSTGGQYNIIEKGKTNTVLIGQDLDFSTNWGGNIVTVSRVTDSGEEWSVSADSNNHLTISADESQWTKSGAFYVNYNATAKTWDAKLTISTPSMPIDLKVGTTSVSSIAKGTPLIVDTSGMNLLENDTVKLVIMKAGSQIKTKPDKNGVTQTFSPISVKNLTAWYGRNSNGIDTTNFDVGTYTFQIKTDPAKACGLDAESAVKELKVIKGKIAIEAEPTDVIELKSVRLTVTGVAGDNIKVESSPLSKHVIFKGGVDDTPTDATNQFNDTIDSDGTRTYSVKFNDTGTYTIRVTVVGGPRDGEYDTTDITVSEKSVMFDLPPSVAIGEKITIKGTATAGTYVDVFIDDVLYSKLDDLVIEDGEFSKEVTTTEVGMNVPGSVRIKAWIDETNNKPGDAPPTRSADGDTALLLTTPNLTAELSQPVVAIEDDFTITGIAKGSKEVEILCVPPKGGGGKSLLDKGKYGLSPRSASVSTTDYTFTKKLTVQEDAAAGYYDIYVLSKGMDGKWGTTNTGTLYGSAGCALDVRYGIVNIESPNLDIGTKTQEDIKEILVDLVTGAGSDDLIWIGRLKVESAYVTLNPIASVAVGEPLVVTATTNRKTGHPFVVTCKGPVELAPQTVPVENGTINATFDTSDAKPGTYTVKADDGDGHTDELTVDIVAAGATPASTPLPTGVTPTPAPTAAPATATPAPATATPVPETPTPTPKPTPGFGASVFTIAGLLAIAYLVLRRRK